MNLVQEYKLVPVRDCPMWDSQPVKDAGQTALAYWGRNIASQPGYNPQLEHAAVLFLDESRRLRGHLMIGRGSACSVSMHTGLVFGSARELGWPAVVVAHNHPGGDPHPSELDLLHARQLARAADSWQKELVDDVIIGDRCFCSLADSGMLAEPEKPVMELKGAQDDYERFYLLGDLLFPVADLRQAFFDHARLLGHEPDQALRTWARNLLKGHIAGAASIDPDLVLTASVLNEPDGVRLLGIIEELAAERGVSAWAYGGLHCREEYLRHLRERLAAKAVNE